MGNMRRVFLAILALLLLASPGGTAAAAEKKKPAAPATQMADRIRVILEDAKAIRDDRDLLPPELATKFSALRRRLLLTDPLVAREAYREVAYTGRYLDLAQRLNDANLKELRNLDLTHKPLLQSFLFALDMHADDPAAALAQLISLREAFGNRVDLYANLAAAICVVHDSKTPYQRRINENTVESADPRDIFGFFINNDRLMVLSMRDAPPELLCYVVDSTASVDEMLWAVKKYHGRANIAQRFFDITYDTENLTSGQIKDITRHGYSLPNLVRFGGVCIDQAYFATGVAKSLGIPAAIITGSGPETSHAWVAFMDFHGRNCWWNMQSGRYDIYKGVRGSTLDPQTRQTISEGDLAILAELLPVSQDNRLDAIALADAAEDLDIRPDKLTDLPAEDYRNKEQVSPQKREDLLRMAVEISPGCRPAWAQVQRLVGQLPLPQKLQWKDAVMRLCGTQYPDFALKILKPLIAGIDNVAQRNDLWEESLRVYRRNADAVIEIRLEQAEMWRENKQADRAIWYCDEIINGYANSGQGILRALSLAEEILVDTNRQRLVAPMYARAFNKTIPPGELAPQFATQSIWYRVGREYAKRLDQAGDRKESDRIVRKLKNMTGADVDLTQ